MHHSDSKFWVTLLKIYEQIYSIFWSKVLNLLNFLSKDSLEKWVNLLEKWV